MDHSNPTDEPQEHAGGEHHDSDAHEHERHASPLSEMTREERCEWIVNGASAAAAAAAAIAPLPGSDSVAIMPIQVAMVAGLAREYDIEVSTALVKSTIYASLGSITGRAGAGLLLRWTPFAGNLVRGGVAAGVTQTMGRMILDRLEAGKELP
ncbi:MAG: DUF697 domain-containing protein [Gemmatimonadetes bacterium]|nr:DUF697 domain-containing protein [Gemmatimonadota bacterium]